jgi:hypothetical protein
VGIKLLSVQLPALHRCLTHIHLSWDCLQEQLLARLQKHLAAYVQG